MWYEPDKCWIAAGEGLNPQAGTRSQVGVPWVAHHVHRILKPTQALITHECSGTEGGETSESTRLLRHGFVAKGKSCQLSGKNVTVGRL